MNFDWKHLLRTETSQESLLKPFYCNNKGTKKVIDFQIFSNKEIYFTGNLLTELGSKETFLKIWNSLLNNNGNFIIQFN